MDFADGGFALFKHCNPDNSDICSILELRDKAGRGIRYERDAAGRLLEMRGDTQKIAFHYDSGGRIDRAEDSLGRSVTYHYDDLGRLSRVRGFDGVERRYGYTDRDQMARIEEPHMTIENRYDNAGRVVRQRIRYAGSDEIDRIGWVYTVRDGQVVQTDTTEFDGTLTRTTYNSHHYRTSQVLDAESDKRVTISFLRDPETNVPRAFQVECADGRKNDVDPRAFADLETEADGASIAYLACAPARAYLIVQ
jgi:YD repeat-containing protein